MDVVKELKQMWGLKPTVVSSSIIAHHVSKWDGPNMENDFQKREARGL